MPNEPDENELIQMAALNNTEGIFLARERAERDYIDAKEALERKREEREHQREWFQVALSSIGDAVITTDTQSKVTFLNPVAESLTGWTSADAVGQPLETVLSIINEDTRQVVENPVRAVLRDGVTLELKSHTTLVGRDGHETSIEDSAAPIRDASGITSGAVMVFHDVTERRRSERALQESKERLNLALAAGQMGAWEWVIATGKVTWSETLERIHGLEPGTFGGTIEHVKREMHPEDRERVYAAIQQGLETGDYRIEYRIIKPDGATAWIEARGRVFHDHFGIPERMAGVCMDITARKRVEDALRTSEEFNRRIIESSRDCTQTLSLNGILLWMSEAAQKSLGIADANAVVGTSWIDFWKGDDHLAAREAVEQATSGGNGNFIGWYEVGGESRCWDVVVTPILNSTGNPEKLLAISRDVTERRRLQEVHARLAAVVEFSSDAIISKTLDGIITTWNRGAERIFGYTEREAKGQPITMLIPPEKRHEEPGILERVRNGEPVPPYETIRIAKNGQRLHVSLTVSPVMDASGTVVGVSKIARDITAQKQATAERARLLSVLEKSLNEIYIFDTSDLRFEYVNEGALRNLGYSMETMRTKTPLDLQSDVSEEEFRDLVAPMLRGEAKKLVFKTFLRRADGTGYPAEVHLQAVTQDQESVFVAVVLDITERKKIEEDRERLLALEQVARAKAEDAENRARFLADVSRSLSANLDVEATIRTLARTAVPAIADWCSVHLLDQDGSIRNVGMAHADPAKVYAAEKLQERFPMDPESPIGVPGVLRSGKPQVFGGVSEELLKAAAKDEEHLGLLRDLQLSSAMVVPIVMTDRMLGTITLAAAESGRHFSEADLPFAEDLAARVAAASENARLYHELRHANATKDHFIAVLSHELRTPLNPVLMTVADLEHDDSVPPAIREQLTVVRRNVELEARLIDDLLDSTRISNGKLQLHRTFVDANELLTRALGIVERDAREKGVDLEVESCPSPLLVDADPARLQQVIWNVVKNAVKFTPEGGWIRVACETTSDDRVRITVQDSGIGIDPAHLEKIFNAFEQGDTHTGHRFGGLGLGLAISKALVVLHGGSLTAQSAGRGKGATFTIDLPVAVEGTAEVGIENFSAVHRKNLRLLVVEDDETTARVMARLLTKRGYEIFSASSIGTALEILETTAVDLLISDVGLPDGSGRELMEQIRERRHLPGIALSGYGTEADLAQSNAVGFSVHLTKPIDIERLDREIQLLAQKHAC